MFYLCMKKKWYITCSVFFPIIFRFHASCLRHFFRVGIYSDGFCSHLKQKHNSVYTNKTTIHDIQNLLVLYNCIIYLLFMCVGQRS